MNITHLKIFMYAFVVVLFLFAFLPKAFAQGATFQVTSLTCSDVAVGGTFSCTATILNAGDAAATVGTITLYTDSNDWLEKTNYPTPGTTIDNGESVEVTFTGLKAVKAGNANGFTQVMMDDVSDTSSSVTGTKVNAVDIAVATTKSSGSVVQGGTFVVTAEITAGGNVDVTLTFTVDSGGCSLGNQDSQKNITGVKHGGKQSATWTVTQGSGDCQYTVTATATGSGTKTDSTKDSVTCSDCPAPSSSGGGGGGSGGGASILKAALGELRSVVVSELKRGEKISFTLEGANHSLLVSSFTETVAELVVQSDPQKLRMTVGDEKKVDLNGDGESDISVKLNSINILTKTVKITLTPLRITQQPSGETQAPGGGGGSAPPSDEGEAPSGGTGTGLVTGEGIGSNVRTWLLVVVIFVIVIAGVIILVSRRKRN